MSVELVKDPAGMEKFVLKEPQGSSAEFYLNGGQVTSWKNAQGEELLFMSKKANFKPPITIRGGIPMGILEFKDVISLHHQGWARNRLWTIDPSPPPPPVNGTKAFVDLILKATDYDLWIKKRPNFEFRLRVALGADSLTVASRIRNIDIQKIKFTFALHTYFPVSDICDVRIEGLETRDYLDNLKDRTRFTEQEDASVTFDGEVDRFYLETPTKIAIIDHGKRRTFALRKRGFLDAVVWNPWDRKSRTIQDLGYGDYKNFVCVGAAAIDELVKLERGQEWKGEQEIRVVSSSYCSDSDS